jgi:hypothetical protein
MASRFSGERRRDDSHVGPGVNHEGSSFRGSRRLTPKEAHLSRATPLSLGRRAVSLPQALGGQSRLINR